MITSNNEMPSKPSESEIHTRVRLEPETCLNGIYRQNRAISQPTYCPVLDLIAEWLVELEGSFFEVILVPPEREDNVGQKLRACVSANPVWYQRLAEQYKSTRGKGRKKMRKPRTFIKKEYVIIVMKRILAGNFKGVYAERILEHARRELDRSRKPSEYVDGIPF